MFTSMLRILVAMAVLVIGVPTAEATEPRHGGTLIIGLEGEPATLIGFLATDIAAHMVASNIFNSLILHDFNFDPTPDLAQSWDISPDGLTYTFHLTEEARWHDGKPVTAEDVEFTFNEIIAKNHPRASSWMPNIETAKAIDAYTFEIQLKRPFAPFMSQLGDYLGSGTLIYPKHIYDGTDMKENSANFAPIGSGPFKFEEWVRGSHVELVRNESYWKEDKPYLDRIVIQFLPDPAARLLAFERGDVDFLHWYIVPHNEVARLREDPRFEIVEKGGEGAATTELLLLNTRNEYLEDPRVRQAIAYAIDREDVKDKALFGEGQVSHSHLHTGVSWAYTSEYDVYHPRDVAKANQLLDEAGFARGTEGIRFSLRNVWSGGREYEGRAAEVIRTNLADVGIDVKIETFDRPTFLDRVFRNGDFDMAHQLFVTGPEPTLSVTTRYHTNQIKPVPFVNAMGYSNAQLDALFDEEFTILDRGERGTMWKEIQRMLMRDLPAIPLWEVPIVNAVSANVKDIITNPYGYIQSRENTYIVE